MKLAIIDFNGTLYDPSLDALMPGAKELLEGLKERGIRMVLVSKQVLGREGLPKQLGIAEYFADMLFVDHKSGALFTGIMAQYGAQPSDTIVIGDYPASEIRAGNEAGAFTVHFVGGRYPSSKGLAAIEVPTAQVQTLPDALQFVHSRS